MANTPLRPPGVKFYSVFLSPRASNTLTPGGYWCWHQMYASGWDWAGFVKPQIDQAKAIGLNCITLMGAFQEILTGGGATYPPDPSFTNNSYLARRKQILEYCRDQGMFVLGYGGVPRFASGTPDQAFIDIARLDAVQMSLFRNCIGYVCLSEVLAYMLAPNNWTQAVCVANAAAYYTPIKNAVPADFGITCDDPCGVAPDASVMDPTAGTPDNMAAMAPYCDWLGFNTFGWNPAPANWAAVRAAYPTKDIMLTSCGEDVDNTGTVNARFTAFMACANHAQCRGESTWVNKDYMTSTGGGFENFGIFNNNDTERAATTPIKAGITVSYPRNPHRIYRGKPALTERTRWEYN